MPGALGSVAANQSSGSPGARKAGPPWTPDPAAPRFPVQNRCRNKVDDAQECIGALFGRLHLKRSGAIRSKLPSISP